MPHVWKVWDPRRRLSILEASTVCCRDNFISFLMNYPFTDQLLHTRCAVSFVRTQATVVIYFPFSFLRMVPQCSSTRPIERVSLAVTVLALI
jgi:hypothetical protein